MSATALEGASPLDIGKWLAEHKEKLEPPVSNACLYSGGDFILQVVGGPNSRNDFHGTPARGSVCEMKHS